MGIYATAVQQLYVAYFNRPADVAGLTYWEGVVTAAKGNTAAVSAAFAASAEYKAAYAGMDEYHVVAQVYQNLFGHGPDLAGLNYWGQLLINKQITIDNVVTQIANGALGTDKTAYADKVSAAGTFTAALDTPAKVLAYSGAAANNVAKGYITSVVDDASLANATAAAALAQTITNVVANAPGSQGQTFVLTQGMDTLTGTSGNDVFQVYSFNPTTGTTGVNNLNSFDTIDGGAGMDTLNIDMTGGVNALPTTAFTTNVETINITANTAAVDASLFNGATLINQIGTAGTVNNLATTTTAAFQSISAGPITVNAAGASAAVSFNKVIDTAAVTVGGSKLASVVVSGARYDGATNGVDALNLTVKSGKDVQTVSVTTDQKTTLTVTENFSTKHVTTVDASTSTGAVTFDATTMTNVANIKTGAGNDTVTIATATAAATSTTAAINASVSTGAGNDTINVNTTGGGLTTVDAGAGDDTINVTKAVGNGLNITGGDGNDTIILLGTNKLDTTDVIDGGAGSNTISLAGTGVAAVADDYIVFNKLLKNFSTLAITGATEIIDASQLAANYTTLNMFTGSEVDNIGSQAVVANGNLTAAAAGYSAGKAFGGNISLSETATGTITANSGTVSLAVKAATGGAAIAATLVGDSQNAIVTVTNGTDKATSPTADVLTSVVVDNTAANANLASLTLKGSGAATVTNVDGTALTSVDASALGGTLVSGAATTGLTYSSTNSAAETIKLGSGIDNVTLGNSHYGSMDTVVGLTLKLNTAGSALSATSDQLHVTGVATTVVAMTTAQTDLDLALKDAVKKGADVVFTMGGDTYVFHDGGTNAGAIDTGDTVVKLAGVTDVKAVIIALGGTPV